MMARKRGRGSTEYKDYGNEILLSKRKEQWKQKDERKAQLAILQKGEGSGNWVGSAEESATRLKVPTRMPSNSDSYSYSYCFLLLLGKALRGVIWAGPCLR